MLVVMTFEIGLLIAVSMGLAVGNTIFSMMIKMPELPPEAKLTEKRGNYEPNPDPCCHKLDDGENLL